MGGYSSQEASSAPSGRQDLNLRPLTPAHGSHGFRRSIGFGDQVCAVRPSARRSGARIACGPTSLAITATSLAIAAASARNPPYSDARQTSRPEPGSARCAWRSCSLARTRTRNRAVIARQCAMLVNPDRRPPDVRQPIEGWVQPVSTCCHFARTWSSNSGVLSATRGNSARRSYGRHASMIALLL